MKTLNVAQLVEAVHGILLTGDKNAAVSALTTDSRNVPADSLFIPLSGESFDGHAFIAKALEDGAAGCLCAVEPEEKTAGKFYIKVEDTRLALKALAGYHRDLFQIPFIQITGSVGKTTTKDMIACVLAEHFSVLKTQGNFNNDIGTPLTLMNLAEEHTAAVIETGMDHFGEIRYLGEIVKPRIAVISNIGDAHIENLGSREGILKAKSEIFENLDSDGIAVLNGDDELLNTVSLPQKILRFGTSEHCGMRIKDIEGLGVEGIRCRLQSEKAEYTVGISSPGVHMAYAAAAAAAVGESLGLTSEEITRGASRYVPSGARMRLHRLEGNRLLLDDCYNANPQSMASSLKILAKNEGKTCAVLGDMGALGDLSEKAHRELGTLCARLNIDCVIAVGEASRFIAEETGDKAMHFDTVEQALPIIEQAFSSNTCVLVKASHFMKFERITAALTEKFPSE